MPHSIPVGILAIAIVNAERGTHLTASVVSYSWDYNRPRVLSQYLLQ